MKLATAFGSKVINESFHNAVNIAKKAAKKFSLLSDKDVFNNILANASVTLFSKTHEVEHNGVLMKNPIGYFTNTFKSMVYDYIDRFRDIHNISKRKTNTDTSSVYYNWLEDNDSKTPSTNTIDNPLAPSIYYKLSKEESVEWFTENNADYSAPAHFMKMFSEKLKSYQKQRIIESQKRLANMGMDKKKTSTLPIYNWLDDPKIDVLLQKLNKN
ncbi:hypothetical protein [Escherichia coli]|uniref:hypothetical protein n=1 Tax=Escherichia coli TaxID=562 RepID=UPI00293BBA4B|nr:hypothetical protein [Escherichia coli]